MNKRPKVVADEQPKIATDEQHDRFWQLLHLAGEALVVENHYRRARRQNPFQRASLTREQVHEYLRGAEERRRMARAGAR